MKPLAKLKLSSKTGVTLEQWNQLKLSNSPTKLTQILHKYGISKELYYFLAKDFQKWIASQN